MRETMALDFGQYRQLLGFAPARRLLIVAMFARVPHAAAGLILTLHVVSALGLSYAAAGGVTAAVTLGIGFGAPWRGRILDRKGLRRTLIPSILAEVIIWSAAAFLPYSLLLLASFIGGALAVPVFTVVRQALGVMVSRQQRRTAYALDSISTEITFMIGPALGVVLATLNSHLALILVGVASSAAGIFLYWFNPPTRSEQLGEQRKGYRGDIDDVMAPAEKLVTGEALTGNSSAGTSLVSRLGDRMRSSLSWFTLAVAAVLAAAVGAGLTLNGTDLGIVATLREHGRQDDIGLVFAAWCLTSIIGGLLYGAARRRVNPLALLLGLALLTLPLGLATDSWSLMLLVLPAGLLCAPVLSAASEWIADLVPEHRRGEAMGWYGSAITLGSALGAPLTGAAMDLVAPWAGFVVIAVIGALIALVGLIVTSMRRRDMSVLG